MTWVWKHLAPYVSATTAIEISGISAEELYDILHQGALDRLKWVEAVIFSEEIDDEEKVHTIQSWLLEE